MMYLQGMTREPTYTAATQQLMYKLQPFPDAGTLPTRFSYTTIAMTLLSHPMALRTTTTNSSHSATTTNPEDTKETLTRYKKMMHPDAKKAAKNSYLKVLQSSCLPENTDLDDLTDQLTNASSWNDGSDDYSMSICNMGYTIPQAGIFLATGTSDSHPSTVHSTPTPELLPTAIQPVCYPDPHMLRMLPSPHDYIMTHPILTTARPTEQPDDAQHPHRLTQVTGQCARIDTRRDLADTGASVSATGRLVDILHHFTSNTPAYEIMGYDGTVTRAAGQSIAFVKGSEHDQLNDMFFVYIPSVDGTIISLEHHTRTHPDIHTRGRLRKRPRAPTRDGLRSETKTMLWFRDTKPNRKNACITYRTSSSTRFRKRPSRSTVMTTRQRNRTHLPSNVTGHGDLISTALTMRKDWS